jgi:hypothetical protein
VSVFAEKPTDDGTPWAKAFDLTYGEFTKRYDSIPKVLFPQELQLTFFNLGVTDFRKFYYGEFDPYTAVYVMCEDTTDKLCAVLTQTDMSEEKDGKRANKAGSDLLLLLAKLMLSVDEDLTIDKCTDILTVQFNLGEIATTPGSKEEYTYNGIAYTASNTDSILTFGFKLYESYKNVDEFWEYRESTLP